MTKTEIGTISTLIVAIAAGALYLGKLEERILRLSQLEMDVDKIEKDMSNISPLPTNAILAWVGREEKIPNGWVLCGQKETVNLDGRFLLGTTKWDEIGVLTGNKGHIHKVENLKTGWEVDGERSRREGADNFTDKPNWNHKHAVNGSTGEAENIPPAVKVFFLCTEVKEK